MESMMDPVEETLDFEATIVLRLGYSGGAYSGFAEQKQDMERVFGKKTKHGLLDYACAWMKKSAEFMENTKIETAFIITNSVTQGQQPAILWQSLAEHGAEINFAYRSFKWTD